MDTQTINVILDLVLIAASVWMIFSVRGIGGIVGKTLNWIVIGAIILGIAHLQATLTASLFGAANGTIHRVVVLVGFVVLVFGFRQLKEMRE